MNIESLIRGVSRSIVRHYSFIVVSNKKSDNMSQLAAVQLLVLTATLPPSLVPPLCLETVCCPSVNTKPITSSRPATSRQHDCYLTNLNSAPQSPEIITGCRYLVFSTVCRYCACVRLSWFRTSSPAYEATTYLLAPGAPVGLPFLIELGSLCT